MKKLGWIAGITAIFAIAFAAEVKNVVVKMDGNVLTSKGLTINGQLYVPASDVAKALGKSLTFSPASKSAIIQSAGGANAAEGANGKLGDWLFNGRTRAKMSAIEELNGEYFVTIEYRNGEKVRKQYYFGFTESATIFFDDADNQFEAVLADRNKDYAIWLEPGSPYKVKYKFKENISGKTIKRCVLRVLTQVSGNPAKQEVFRIQIAD